MSLERKRRSGFVLRMLGLCAFSCALVFSGIVVLENEELNKLVPPGAAKSMAMIFGYLVAMVSFNYLMAIRGGNFMGWKIELSMMLGLAALFIAILVAFAFPQSQSVRAEGVRGLVGLTVVDSRPNWTFLWGGVLAIPLLAYSFRELTKLPLWQSK